MNDIIGTCNNCRKIPTRQSDGRCPTCGGRLTLVDLSKMPLEREEDWPPLKNQNELRQEEETKMDYRNRYKRKDE